MLISIPLSISKQNHRQWHLDMSLLIPVMALLSVGLVMISSASFSFGDHRLGDELFFFKRHLVYLVVAALAMATTFFVPATFWSKYSRLWIFISFVLLIMVLIPGVGRELNGSRRWLAVGGFTLQVSELVKVATVVFLATYLDYYRTEMAQDWRHFARLMLLLVVLCGLLIREPDFGSVVVLSGTFMAMLFLGGAKLRQYVFLIAICAAALWWLKDSSPYRMARITAYLDPWSDQFNSGYQLTQSLIAFGRGEWFGVGLGQSVQKMLYLPEAHTDFVFAIFAEEFGFLGVIGLIGLYCLMILRIFVLSRQAISQQSWYAAFVLIGFGLIISGQTFINIGVNAGLLPTKGLTLPFVSYGGSSLLVSCAMIGMLLRFSHDLKETDSDKRRILNGRR
jgi:cell division protein FtsW